MTHPIKPGDPLTAKQQRIWDMKNEGKTIPEIAVALGITANVVEKQVTSIYKKQPGLKNVAPQENKAGAAPDGAEFKAPDSGSGLAAPDSTSRRLPNNPASAAPENPVIKVIDYADVQASKIVKVNQTMLESGFPERLRMAHIRRLKVKHAGEETAPKRLTTPEITGLIEEKIHLGLSYMDDKAFSEASARDLAVAVSSLIEKRALLRGEPTQILSNHERAKLHELLPLAIAEAQRRGLTIPGTVTEKTIEPA